jgi:hypothetical protein
MCVYVCIYMFTFGKIFLPLMNNKYTSTNIFYVESVLVVMHKD